MRPACYAPNRRQIRVQPTWESSSDRVVLHTRNEDCNHPIDLPYTIESSKDSRPDLVTPEYSMDKHSRKIVVDREDR
jgi:hypothetical protein